LTNGEWVPVAAEFDLAVVRAVKQDDVNAGAWERRRRRPKRAAFSVHRVNERVHRRLGAAGDLDFNLDGTA
jgi:hypothetical protein